MKKIILLGMFLLLATAVSADLSQYPKQFITGGSFQAQIVIGNAGPSTDVLAAAEIAVSLQSESSTPVLAISELEFNPNQDAIIIGLPCQSPAMAEVLETNVCDIGLEDGQGFLKLFSRNNVAYLIVTGKTAADTRKAARYLAQYGTYSLKGDEIRVGGSLTTPVEDTDEEILVIEKKIIPDAYCNLNRDCAIDQICRQELCLDLNCLAGTQAEDHKCVVIPQAVTPDPEPEPELIQEPEPVAPSPEPAPEKGFIARIIEFIKGIFS